MLLIMNIPMVRVFAAMLRIPAWILVPGIVVISFIGVYALHSATFDLGLVVAIGAIGYFLRKFGVPLPPLVLGVVLGNLMEQNLRRALSITNGELFILWESPITKGLWLASLFIVVVPWAIRRLKQARSKNRDVSYALMTRRL
jgi:putative tricarboxylic transport membrane protein